MNLNKQIEAYQFEENIYKLLNLICKKHLKISFNELTDFFLNSKSNEELDRFINSLLVDQAYDGLIRDETNKIDTVLKNVGKLIEQQVPSDLSLEDYTSYDELMEEILESRKRILDFEAINIIIY
ncbi:hypothetical protein GF376_01375 [Candidatus Peregrinibacteria bacterium]|nr:hypothetical protein [Candidatus Peregrinibacteria bacterium]